MIQVIDKISEIEEKILTGIKKSSSNAHKSNRLLSERKLAELYSVSRAQVREAVKRLIKKKLLYNIPGSGTYINNGQDRVAVKKPNYSMFSFPDIGELETVKIRVKGLPQGQAWEKVIKLFTEKYPFIELAAGDDDDVDVVFNKTFELSMKHEDFCEMNTVLLNKQGFIESELCPNILKSCEVNGKLLGIPILRTTAGLYANKKLMEEYGITSEQINDCDDIFKLGDMVEEQSNGKVIGTRYLGLIYHAALEGVAMECDRDKINFNSEKVRCFLEKIKPYIKKRHLTNPDSQLSDFINDKCLFYPDFLAIYPSLKESNSNLEPINMPCKRDGFACEWMYLGSIHKNAQNPEEASLLLAFLTGTEAQEVFIEHLPYWLSVRTDILDEQKKILPLPEKMIDFDIRSYYSQLDSRMWEAGPKINREVAKYFVNMQNLDETIEKIKHCCRHISG